MTPDPITSKEWAAVVYWLDGYQHTIDGRSITLDIKSMAALLNDRARLMVTLAEAFSDEGGDCDWIDRADELIDWDWIKGQPEDTMAELMGAK